MARNRLARRGGAGGPILLLIIAVVAVCAAWKLMPVPTGTGDWHVTLADGLADADARDVNVVVMFTADWCGPCQFFKQHVLRDGDVAEVLGTSFTTVKIDLTERSGPNSTLAGELGVRAIPALHMYDADGYIVSRYDGQPDAGAFLRWLDPHR
ncbi:MAG: thioredoxin family protein [Phycisphaerae bacterium]|nr:thioredoxin family protein [Phycisphaerae bacterium]